jgi:gamma-glutamyltranspeptidase/glutathione hydrolase
MDKTKLSALTLIMFLILSMSLLSMKAREGDNQGLPEEPTDPRLNQGPKQEAVGDKVMVSTQLPIVTQAALKVLSEGGNAIDAMITAVFLQHVNDYHQVSHFGTMSAICYESSTGKYHVISAVSERPQAKPGKGGDASKVAIGGVVRGLEALAKRFGTKPWASYLEPAIASAEEGVIVTSFMYGINYALFEHSDLIKNKEARDFYMPEGFLVPVGKRWKMPKLAEHLRKVASEGADYMYTGAWGQRFVKKCNKRGYQVSEEDMAAYKPKWQEPVRFTYRGHTIIGSPPPDTGGLVVGSNLTILENFDLRSTGHYTQSAETLEIMARALGRVRDETRWAIKDPLNFQVPADVWLSKEYGKMSAQIVRQTMVQPDVNLSSVEEAEESKDQSALSFFHIIQGEDRDYLGSNHNVIVDGDGNWISLLHTGHGGAPGVFIDGVRATGSSARAYTAGPGRRLVLPITAIMIEKDGKPWMAMGTPGLPPQPITIVLVNILDFDMPPKEAADAPRFWAFRGGERALEIESRITDEVRTALKKRGIKIRDLGRYNWHTGSVQIIWRDQKTGKLHGVTDPRRLGCAAGF